MSIMNKPNAQKNRISLWFHHHVWEKWRYWLILTAFASLVFFGARLGDVVKTAADAVFEAQWIEKRSAVNVICDLVERSAEIDGNWDENDYATALVDAVQSMDAWHGVSVRLYDEQLKLLSERRAPENETPIALIDSEDVVRFVSSGVSDETDMPFGSEIHRLYYRWLSSIEANGGCRVLVVVALAHNALIVNPSGALTIWCARLLAVAGIAVLLAAIALVEAGRRRLNRTGE